MIEDICVNEILGGFKKFDLDSIVSEYPDEFVRKMRMTGLISFRGGGRFIDINHNEDDKIIIYWLIMPHIASTLQKKNILTICQTLMMHCLH